tara:strand:+ start:16 stop:516 length:501 start_codon:yes stop_codon:yes gene_type:complete
MAQTSLGKFSAAERLNSMAVDLITVTPDCDPSGTDDNDVLFDYIEIPNAVAVTGGSAIIQSITIIDDDDQGTSLDLVFQTDSTSLGTKDAAVSIDSGNEDDILGFVSVSNYFDGINFQVGTKTNIGLVVKAASDTKSIFIAGVNRNGGSVTHTASGLKIKIGIVKD